MGTKHPLPPASLAVRRIGIIAQRTAVPVQRAPAAAMRTRRLLEGKKLGLQLLCIAPKMKRPMEHPAFLPEGDGERRAFFTARPDGATRWRKDLEKRATAPDGTSATLESCAPSEAWCLLQGASPCWVRNSQPPVPSVGVLKEQKK
jgi:hypothetical protein